MVIIKEYPPKWKCPYCNTKYDEEDEAMDCARECIIEDIDSPIETDGDDDEYICEYCDKSFRRGTLAEQCEEKHVEREDAYYFERQRKESMERLAEAAAHPSQIKLCDY